MVNLWSDIQCALEGSQKLLHFSTEPISVADVAKEGFGWSFSQHFTDRTPGFYDMHSNHTTLFGQKSPYMYSKKETLMAIRAYAQSEPKTLIES